ncbi:MAG: VOC family protein [Bacteroidetes bacterium]|nr:VOC family protein [Bacteroidota bacterium]
MNFSWVTLHVQNIEKSLEFYQGLLNLPINSRFAVNDVEIVMLGEDGKTKIELLHDGRSQKIDGAEGISIGLEVDSLDQSMELMKSRQIPIQGPFSPSPHISFFFIKDPDGVSVQLLENK